jgi:hypothetical protein
MQLKNILILIPILFSLNAFSYECKSIEYKTDKLANKKSAFKLFKTAIRDDLVSGVVYELTSLNPSKINQVNKSKWLLDYLENTEVNSDQQALFSLLKSASEIDTSKPRNLEEKELCEIMNKVNQLVEKKVKE